MEDIIDIFEETVYSAVYDPVTFQIIKVGPSFAFQNECYQLPIDENVAVDIIQGKIRISNCYIDPDSNTLELVEKMYVSKIDDVLHRIVEKKWNTNANIEIFLRYKEKNKVLDIQMTSVYFGSRKIKNKKQRKINWSGDTVMNFYITAYNDPHILYHSLEFTIDELIGKTKSFKNLNLPERFSIFTRRIFKGYVLELK